MEIYTREDAELFITGKMDGELWEYLRGCLRPKQVVSKEDSAHVIHCLKGMVAELFELHPCGSFGQAVLRNDLFQAVGRADATNITCLNLYVVFLYNCVPSSLLIRYRRKGGE